MTVPQTLISHLKVQQALRTKLKSLVAATTGSTNLSVSGGKYTRAAGSFITDNFWVGMEVTSAGFATAGNNGVGQITSLTATTIGVDRALVNEAAGAGRTLSVGLPAIREWEKIRFTPVLGRPYVQEQYIPGPAREKGASSVVENEPMYAINIYTPQEIGMEADSAYIDALLELFRPRTSIPVSDGHIIRVRSDIAPFRSQRQNGPAGWTVSPVSFPLRLHSLNIT